MALEEAIRALAVLRNPNSLHSVDSFWASKDFLRWVQVGNPILSRYNYGYELEILGFLEFSKLSCVIQA